MLFGKNPINPKRLHVSVATGMRNSNGIPLLSHMSEVYGQIDVWPINMFGNFIPYRELVGIRRLNVEAMIRCGMIGTYEGHTY